MIKKYKVLANDKSEYIIELENEIAGQSPWKAKINGKEYIIDVDDINDISSILINKVSHIVSISKDADNLIESVEVDGDSHKIYIEDIDKPKRIINEKILSYSKVNSPINGKIILINYKENDIVKKDDVILVIEAMKMENEIKSPIDGYIKELSVTINNEVNTNEQLFIIDTKKD